MKQFFKMFFASVLGVIVAGVIVIGIFIGAIIALANSAFESKSSAEKVVVKDNTVLRIDCSEQFHEQGENNTITFMSAKNGAAAGVFEICQSLEKAAKDSKVKGLFIKLAPSPNSFATLQQIRNAVLKFKASGKFVYAYGESIPQSSLYLASVADSIYLNPVGDIELKGLATELMFFKNALAKLEIEPQIFYAGKFKSATEPFRADKISEPNRIQIMALQADIWNEMTQAIAQHAKVSQDSISKLAVMGKIQFPQDALQNNMIDGIKYWDEVESVIKAKLKIEQDKSIAFSDISDYYTNSSIILDNESSNNSKIAVIFAEGEIKEGKSMDNYEITDGGLVKIIRKLKENDDVKAVVLRVNSPGGSARASDIILRELQLLHDKKPIVVSMGDLAASGGYYISCAADSIFAIPTTITGSIGVFSYMFNPQKLLTNKIGITFDQVKNAPYADFPNATREMNENEKIMMQSHVDTIYAQFKRHVMLSRKMTEEDVNSIAQGRVWTGIAAKQNRLIDEFGGLERAVKSAAALAKIDKYQLRTYPEKVDNLKNLMKMLKTGDVNEDMMTKVFTNTWIQKIDGLMHLQKIQNMNGKMMMQLPFEVSFY